MQCESYVEELNLELQMEKNPYLSNGFNSSVLRPLQSLIKLAMMANNIRNHLKLIRIPLIFCIYRL